MTQKKNGSLKVWEFMVIEGLVRTSCWARCQDMVPINERGLEKMRDNTEED